MVQILQVQNFFPASSNQVLTSMGWGVQKGGGGYLVKLSTGRGNT